MLRRALIGSLLSLFLAAHAAPAKMSPDDIARLGKDLTPLGAEKAGNKEGTIPAWEGGLTKPPAGWKPGMHYIDPFPEDKPLFTITAANMDQYGDKLTAGQKAMLKAYKTFYMNIYPTRRTAAFPQRFYEGTKKVAASVELVGGGNGVIHAVNGFPFPIPKNGTEAIWNLILRPHGLTGWEDRRHVSAAVTRSGDYALTKFQDWAQVHYWDARTTEANLDNILWRYKQNILSPPRQAGQVLLLHETVDQHKQPRMAWVYNPGQRRVRRAPEYAFDNPWAGSDGLKTIDSVVMFNGSPERYDWKLVGKKEMYIPYNAYRLQSPKYKYKDLIKPLHINPEPLRYELHRVWIVEGTLKPGARHIYKRRVIYLDEDSWFPGTSDVYDNRDQLWRVGEDHGLNYYDVPFVTYNMELWYDLQSGRYCVDFMSNEEPPWNVGKVTDPDDFTVDSIRREGVR
ncbi:MAG: DUF1329 domain-containing protein [Deltaproteobacteria bacterium]|nr:DUF1329 domain-containing protein [Deltaproteobacteria bacterium]